MAQRTRRQTNHQTRKPDGILLEARHRPLTWVHTRLLSRLRQRRRACSTARQHSRRRMRSQDCRCRPLDIPFPRSRTRIRIAGPDCRGNPLRQSNKRRRSRNHIRRSQRRTRNAGDAIPHELPQEQASRKGMRAYHRRTILRRHFRSIHRTHIARSGCRWQHCLAARRRHHNHRYTRTHHRRRTL